MLKCKFRRLNCHLSDKLDKNKFDFNKSKIGQGRLRQRETVHFVNFGLRQNVVGSTPSLFQAKINSPRELTSETCLTLRLWKMSEISQPQKKSDFFWKNGCRKRTLLVRLISSLQITMLTAWNTSVYWYQTQEIVQLI